MYLYLEFHAKLNRSEYGCLIIFAYVRVICFFLNIGLLILMNGIINT